ncbi:Hypothetical predicted protein [Lynx pardinus]|uniref:Uncharacterized protein n=1 Tax=Lynx pardinus TaxID=191816 RepID=A0A485MHP7_LYNPA|nr:Hypothetical predicted protein [Lynx pardinus]
MVSSFTGIRKVSPPPHSLPSMVSAHIFTSIPGPRGPSMCSPLETALVFSWPSGKTDVPSRPSSPLRPSCMTLEGVSSSPIHHQGPAILLVDAQLSLDVSVPEQRCSSCYLGRLWPQKYLVSSHSVKWN